MNVYIAILLAIIWVVAVGILWYEEKSVTANERKIGKITEPPPSRTFRLFVELLVVTLGITLGVGLFQAMQKNLW